MMYDFGEGWPRWQQALFGLLMVITMLAVAYCIAVAIPGGAV